MRAHPSVRVFRPIFAGSLMFSRSREKTQAAHLGDGTASQNKSGKKTLRRVSERTCCTYNKDKSAPPIGDSRSRFVSGSTRDGAKKCPKDAIEMHKNVWTGGGASHFPVLIAGRFQNCFSLVNQYLTMGCAARRALLGVSKNREIIGNLMIVSISNTIN